MKEEKTEKWGQDLKILCNTCALYDECFRELNPKRTLPSWEAPRCGPIEEPRRPFAFTCDRYIHKNRTAIALLKIRRIFE